jgi:hypothetical protein
MDEDRGQSIDSFQKTYPTHDEVKFSSEWPNAVIYTLRD